MFRNAMIVVTLLVAGAGSAYAADAAHGAAIFKRCAMCHTDAKGAGNGLGPNLFGVVGHEAATHPGFTYSGALKKSHLIWTPANLDKWLTRPAQLVPGTKMMFAGLPNAADRADVIAFLASQK